MVGFNRRFIPLMRRAREIVEERGFINQCVSTFYKNILSQEPPYYSGAVDVLTSRRYSCCRHFEMDGGAKLVMYSAPSEGFSYLTITVSTQ
jgi:hypothetical protein